MTAYRTSAAAASDEVYLPPEVTTFNGSVISTTPNVWEWPSLAGKIVIDFSVWDRWCPALMQSAKSVFAWYAENYAEATVRNYARQMERFVEGVGPTLGNGPIEARHITAYRGQLDSSNDWYIGQIAPVVHRWSDGWPGVASDASVMLRRMVVPGNPKGVAVRTLDPLRGPFSDAELQSLKSGAHRAYADGAIDLEDYVLSLLFIAFAPRPVQLAAAKVSDLRDCSAQPVLLISRAKQGVPARTDFRERALDPALAALIRAHVAKVGSRYRDRCDDPPMFGADIDLMGVPGFEFHVEAGKLGTRMIKTLRKTASYSERTGEIVRVSPRRFRYTLATRMAEEGYSAAEIAEALDHSDLQNVQVYMARTPELIDRIDEATAFRMAPLAKAFAGQIVSKANASTEGDALLRVRAPEQVGELDPIGNCSNCGDCGLPVPLACYTCVHFRPWIEAPHGEVLTWTIAKRDKAVARQDKRMSSALDRTIFAIGQVVVECQALV